MYGLFAVAAMSGARSGELLALRQTDYDSNKGLLRIRHSLRDLGGNLSIAQCKTPKSKRNISLPPRAIEALRIHREQLFGAFEPLSLFPGVVFPICNHAIQALRNPSFVSVRTGKGPCLLDKGFDDI